jgi:DNA-3-methyladenine glycosylase
MKLPHNFYNQSTIKIARQLLGKFLISKVKGKKIVGMITETEAYVGPNDKASHASRGKTPRTEIMFGEPGYWYIYLIYGMYYCLNIVTEHKNYPAAVLIRAVKPVSGLKPEIKTDGPGKLCKAFKIDKNLNGKTAFDKKTNLWIEDRGLKIKSSQIKKSPRIGVDYAKEYKDKLWRFYINLNY